MLIEDKVEIIVGDFFEDFHNFDDDFLYLLFQEILLITRLTLSIDHQNQYLPFPSNDRLIPFPSLSFTILLRISSKRKSHILIRDVLENSRQSDHKLS